MFPVLIFRFHDFAVLTDVLPANKLHTIYIVYYTHTSVHFNTKMKYNAPDIFFLCEYTCGYPHCNSTGELCERKNREIRPRRSTTDVSCERKTGRYVPDGTNRDKERISALNYSI